MQVTLGSPETFHAIEHSTWKVGDYKGHAICGSQFGHFIVQADGRVLTFAGFITYTATPQEAGMLVDSHLATQKRAKSKSATIGAKKKTASRKKPSSPRTPKTRS